MVAVLQTAIVMPLIAVLVKLVSSQAVPWNAVCSLSIINIAKRAQYTLLSEMYATREALHGRVVK